MNKTKDTFSKINNKHLYELVRRKEKFSEYIDGEYSEHIKNLISEILELEKEIEINGDIKGEVADVIYMVAQLLNKLNKDNLFEPDFEEHKGKIMGRSPNLKKCKKISREDENNNWKLLKNKQSKLGK